MRPKDLFKMVEVKIDLEKCDGCGTCVDICPTVYEVRNGKPTVLNADYCLACMVCVVECPNNAIEISLDEKKNREQEERVRGRRRT